jgi:hypothetical protein
MRWPRRRLAVGCRPVNNGPTGELQYIWTVKSGEGIVHPHGRDGCPFEPGGPYDGRADEVLAGLIVEQCDCDEVHGEGEHE